MELSEIKEVVVGLQKDWQEFMTTNDDRLSNLEKDNGVAEITEKLERIDASIDVGVKANEQYGIAQEALQKRVDEAEAALDRRGPAGTPDDKAKAEYKAKFFEFVRGAIDKSSNVTPEAIALKQLHQKAVSTTTAAAGGAAVPEEISRQILSREQELSSVRQDVKVVSVGSSDYKELIDMNGATTEWLGETATRNETNTPELRERTPTMGTLSAKPKATEESLQDIFFNVEAWLVDSVARGMTIAEGLAVLLGDGSNKPTGMLNTAPSSITDAETNSPQRSAEALEYVALQSGSPRAFSNGDGLIDMVYRLRSGYRNQAKWAMNSLTAGTTRKLKDSQDQYVWAPGLEAGEPTQLLGYPVRFWEDLADIANDSLSFLFGDFARGYVLVDRSGMRLTVDDITVPGYVNFYVRQRLGGIITDNNAIKVGKLSLT